MATHYNPKIITDGLVLCLDAANKKSYSGSGTAWKDLSGNNKNFNWISSPSFINNGSKSYFNTLNNRCTGPASNSFNINDTSGYTIFLICMQNNISSDSAAFKFYRNNQSGLGGRGIFSHCAWLDNSVYLDQGGCCNSDTRTVVSSGGTLSWNIWTFRRLTNSSTRTISKNGITLTTNTNTAASLNLDSRGIDLGSSDENGGDNSVWDAKLNSFYVYNRGLSDIEILQNFNGLKGRFNL